MLRMVDGTERKERGALCYFAHSVFGLHVLPQEASRASELLASLNSDQQIAAILGSDPPSDIYAGPARQNALTSFQGKHPIRPAQ